MALLRDTSKNGKAVEPQNLPQAPEFYANTIVVNASAFEFELQHLLIDSQKNVKAAVNVRMSPQTAWTLWKALGHQIEQCEVMNGESSLPPELKKALG